MGALRHRSVLAALPFLVLLLVAAINPSPWLQAAKAHPVPALSTVLIALLVMVSWRMTHQLWTVQQDGKLWRQAWCRVQRNETDSLEQGLALQGAGFGAIVALIRVMRGQVMTNTVHARLDEELLRLSSRHERRMQLSELLAGLTVGLGVLATFYNLLAALTAVKSSGVETAAHDLHAALAAAIFTAIATISLGSMLIGIRGTLDRLGQLMRASALKLLKEDGAVADPCSRVPSLCMDAEHRLLRLQSLLDELQKSNQHILQRLAQGKSGKPQPSWPSTER